MISGFLLVCLTLVTHAPGWSYPVITINDPYWDYCRKTIAVTNQSHVHQIWSLFQGQSRIGYKIILPDGTELYPETMISNDVFAAYPTCTIVDSDSIAAFWREGNPAWHQIREHDGTVVVPTSVFTTTPWVIHPEVSVSSDTLGRIHATFETSAGVCYSVTEPGIGEIWRDTIPESQRCSWVLVDGERVHICFNGPDQWADYIQYDLDGNVTVPTVNLVPSSLEHTYYLGMAVDSVGDIYVFLLEHPGDLYLTLYKLDGEIGSFLIYRLIVYQPPPSKTVLSPVILSTPSGQSFYLLWLEEDDLSSNLKWVRSAVIDTNGEFIVEPYTAYDYSDEEMQDIKILKAATNEYGDIFAHWSAYFEEVGSYYIVLGWFDHNFLGVMEPEEETISVGTPFISASQNPFTETVTFTCTGLLNPQNLLIYDLSGRLIRKLEQGEDNIYLWDGNDLSGKPVVPGTYLVRVQVGESSVSLRVTRI